MTELHEEAPCARTRSVSPHQCYSHEDMCDAENRAAESVRQDALPLVMAAIGAMGVLAARPESKVSQEARAELAAGLERIGAKTP